MGPGRALDWESRGGLALGNGASLVPTVAAAAVTLMCAAECPNVRLPNVGGGDARILSPRANCAPVLVTSRSVQASQKLWAEFDERQAIGVEVGLCDTLHIGRRDRRDVRQIGVRRLVVVEHIAV
jgi:hypothetical protein